MDNEHIILNSRPISIASYTNYKEAVFLISVLDEPDSYGRIIPEEAGEKYFDTIIGYPIVAKLKKNIFGQPVDFGGHELTIQKTKDGKKKSHFDTVPIGSVTDAWIEEREVDGYDGMPKCILIKTKLWTSRFPEYFKVFDKLWDDGEISSSWELTATDVVTEGANKIYKVFEFIGNCILGSNRNPAVPGAGVIEYAEMDDLEEQLSSALLADISNTDIANYEDIEEKEDMNLAEKTKKDVSVEDTEKEKETPDSVDETEKDKKKKDEETAEKKKKTSCAEDTSGTKETAESAVEPEGNPEEPETASLTDRDLFRKINKACEDAIKGWGYVSYWFPEEHTVWFKSDDAPTQLDYKLFTYTVENDEVTVSEPQDVKLTVSVSDVNTVLAEKDEKIETLTAELEIKDKAVISAGEKIGKLNVQISELQPYKEQVEKAEQEKIEAEIAEEKESLKKNLLKGGLFTEEEIAKAEIAELIEARDKTAINSLIAEKYIASFDKEETDVAEDVETEESNPVTATASLETDDVNESASSFMTKFLSRR